MNSTHYALNVDPNMKKSFLLQSYSSYNMPGTRDNPSLSKRSSFNMTHQYQPQVQYPKTPKANNNTPFNMDNFSVSNKYYHQNSYLNHHPYQNQINQQNYISHNPMVSNSRLDNSSHRVQISTSRVQPAISKIQAFSLQQRKFKQPSLQQRVRQLGQKLQKMALQVQKHEKNFKNPQFSQNVSNSPQVSHHNLAGMIQQTISQQLKFKQIESNMHLNFVKNEVEELKIQIKKFAERSDVQQRIGKVGSCISKAIETVNKELMSHLSSMTQMQNWNRKKQIEKVKSDMEAYISIMEKGWQQKIKKQKDQSDKLTECSSYDTLPTRKIFLGDPILIKFATKVMVNSKDKTNQIEDNQLIYRVDDDGFLLDTEGRYILNSKYEQIKLNNQQLQIIREKWLLK